MMRQGQYLKIMLAVGISLLLLAGISCSSKQPEMTAKLIPREVLFGNPEKSNPQLSPDGLMMSYTAPVNGVLNVWVGTIGQSDAHPVTNDTLRGIWRYFWSNDNKHIMYLQDRGGDENWRLYAVNLGNGEIGDLTPFDSVQVRIIATDKSHPDEILIAMNKENRELHDVYSLDLPTGKLTLVAKNSGQVARWLSDPELRIRGAVVANSDGGFDLLIRDSENSDWRTLMSWTSEDALNSGPVTFTRDDKYLYYADSRDANTTRLLKMDMSTGESSVVAEDQQSDVVDAIINPDTYDVQAVVFEKDRMDIVALDESIKQDIEAIRAIHAGDFFLTSRDDADDTWLVGFTTDNGPIPYYSYDRKTKQATFLFDHRTELNDYTLTPMEPIQIESRDGLTLHGYISFPPCLERKKLPTVLLVHGGPWARDTWGFSPEAQWITNRGYICLQVNFRGSTGYGKQHLNAGDREWGGKMHDDLIDAVNWAVDQGYADRKRVAIYGASYGGYAALVGATFTPDVFCCAVDAFGPSNLSTFMNSIPPYWSSLSSVFKKRIGDPAEGEEFLKSRSPLFKVDQIKVPMLIAQGANDPRVAKAESDRIVDALKKNSVDYEYIVFDDEGHGFARPENSLKFYSRAEEFLSRHLGGRFEGSPATSEQ